MTEQETPTLLVDPGNPFLAPGNALVVVEPSPDKQHVIFTVRTGNATVTLLLDGEAAQTVEDKLEIARRKLSRLVLPTGPIDLSKIRAH